MPGTPRVCKVNTGRWVSARSLLLGRVHLPGLTLQMRVVFRTHSSEAAAVTPPSRPVCVLVGPGAVCWG